MSCPIVKDACLEDGCDFWDIVDGCCVFVSISKKLSSLNYLQEHVHRMHRHNLPHDSEHFALTHGGACPPIKITRAGMLSQEFSAFEDVDQNGQVFLRDFYIDPEDEDCPPMIIGFYQRPDIKGRLANLKKMTWAEYLKTLPFKG